MQFEDDQHNNNNTNNAAELAASNMVAKHAGLSSQGAYFVLIAIESNSPVDSDAVQFLSELGR